MPYLINIANTIEHYSTRNIMLIGKDPTCEVKPQSELVADRHARIEAKCDGYLLRDLRSGLGTKVNGQFITEKILEPGDEIEVGSTTYLFSLEFTVLNDLGMTSKNQSWKHQLKILGEVAPTDYPVLILGPSGTGKEVLAHALHKNSKRKEGPFISVNCSALSETLIESELFGHLKGSFTGAINDRKGAFESARGGTLFLDEIGDLPYCLQAKLLRALENNEIRPVGSDRNTKTDVRIIAATHQNLIEKMTSKEFRTDLYFRLNVVTANIPSLKERVEDFDDLLMTFCKQLKVSFSVPAMLKMREHHWPGNIRELKNTVTRAAVFFPRTRITENHVDAIIDKLTILPGFTCQPLSGAENNKTVSLPIIKEIEKQMIVKRMIANHGNQRKTAQELGIPKSTLHDRLKTYSLNAKDFSARALQDSKVLERLSL